MSEGALFTSSTLHLFTGNCTTESSLNNWTNWVKQMWCGVEMVLVQMQNLLKAVSYISITRYYAPNIHLFLSQDQNPLNMTKKQTFIRIK